MNPMAEFNLKLRAQVFGMARQFLPQCIVFSVVLYVYLWIADKYGFDRAFMSLGIIIFLTLLNIEGKLCHPK